MAIFFSEKMIIFGNFFLKKEVFDSKMAIFWRVSFTLVICHDFDIFHLQFYIFTTFPDILIILILPHIFNIKYLVKKFFLQLLLMFSSFGKTDKMPTF